MVNINDIEIDNLFSNTSEEIKEVADRDIAIIGMSVKFPKAENIMEFWENIRKGVDCIDNYPDDRQKDVLTLLESVGEETKDIEFGKGAYLSDIDKFDYSFFQLSPKEASLMNPNQRLFLQTAWRAIEDAGYSTKKIKGTNTGLYLGYSTAPFLETVYDYSRFIAENDESMISLAIPGNLNSMIASRLSYYLDLKGPSMLIDTACSSSLVAVHTACQSIRNGECEMAIAGGVKLNLFPIQNENFKLGIESSDDRAKTFDENSDGTGRGEGVAAIILKPLSSAIRDGDNIYSVIKGSAINQDGSSIGITAPNALSQQEVINSAWEDADINPESISYIEAHGTGTKLGDPVEIHGITQAFRQKTNRKQFCAVGSVKTNIGHLDGVSGLAGLIKACLALKHKELPPSLHFNYPNKKINFEESPVYVNTYLRKWESEGDPRRCGVSSFGLSGTNCHIVLEEAPEQSDNVFEESGYGILTLSAKNEKSLKDLISEYESYISEEESLDILRLCYTANTGREHFSHRIALVIRNKRELVSKLQFLQDNGLVHSPKDRIFFNSIHEENGENNTNFLNEKKINKQAINEKIVQFSKNIENNVVLLDEICTSYVDGEEIEWNTLYSYRLIRKLSIPGYAFEKKRCWIQVNKQKKKEKIISKIDIPSVILTGRPNGTYSEDEIKIARIWGDFLGFEKININDNFYELGGDSIIAAKIVNAVSLQVGEKIEITSLLKFPSIKDFTKEVMSKQLNNTREIDIKPLPQEDYYPASMIQKQIFAQAQFKEMGTALNTPIVLEFKGKLEHKRVQEIFEKLVKRHDAFRTHFGFKNGDLVQYIENEITLEVKTLNTSSEELQTVLEDQIQIFDLSVAPLARVRLINVSNEYDVLFIDLHHIVSDGVSFDILVKEFMSLYNDEILPKLSVQYKDYTSWFEEYQKTHKLELQKEYWKNVLDKELSELELPYDYDRSNHIGFEGKTVQFKISKEIVDTMKELSRKENVTLNTLFFTAYNILLNKYSNQNDLVVGTVVNGRSHIQLENIVGAFVNLLPIRNQVNAEDTISQFIHACNDRLLSAFDNQEFQYTSMIEHCRVPVKRGRNPIFDTAVIFHNEYDHKLNLEVEGVPFSVKVMNTNKSQLDLKLDILGDEAGELIGLFEYKTSLFKEDTIQEFIRSFQIIIKQMLKNLETVIGDIEYESTEIKEEIEKNSKIDSTLNIAISATFTSEPIEEHLNWWAQNFDLDIDIKFAPYNQVFMELLEPSSLLSTNNGVNILFIRFEDWIRNRKSKDDFELCNIVRDNFQELLHSLSVKQKGIPYFIGVFPVSKSQNLSSRVREFLEEITAEWFNELKKMENVFPIDLRIIEKLYQIPTIFDSLKDKEGHVPFTDEFYAAMGASVIRKVHSLKNQDFKVIVLDCDNTLWKGVCGEDGALGIEINENFINLQKFMLNKYNEGMLLAISSKNNERDVWEVFEKNSDMILKKEHFVSHKINWSPKSENLKALAEELNLGLNSFIFIDDNAAECSEVMTNCPEVLTLHLPRDDSDFSNFIQHVWAFDKLIVTEEDRKRTKMYISEKQRHEVKQNTLSLSDYLKGLNLKLTMQRVKMEQVPRVAQLTKRTNQFNLSTKRMSEADIENLILSDNVICWAIEVSDRFGDYGLVGVVIAKIESEIMFVDTFLLSCRVLGRTVEDAILSCLGNICNREKLYTIEMNFYPTEKNQPFLNFIEKTGWKKVHLDEIYTTYRLSVSKIKHSSEIIDISFESEESDKVEKSLNNEANLTGSVMDVGWSLNQSYDQTHTWTIDIVNEENLYHRKYLIPLEKHTANSIVNLPKENKSILSETNNNYVAPTTEAEKRIAEIWEEVLGIEKVSITDNFFEIGGTSLHGIQVISKISMEFEAELNDIFEYDTIEKFAKNVPFNKNYLLSLLNKKESMAKNKNINALQNDSAIQSKLNWYNKKIEAYKNVNLTELTDYKNILLTGATGYLGSHLLFELLTETQSDIYVLVRGKDIFDAEERLKKKLSFYFDDSFYGFYRERIHILNGDLMREFLNLSQEKYDNLSTLIDCIINPAANVSHYGKYEDSYQVNVKGTERLIEFASYGKLKDYHHVSTPLVAFGRIEGVDDFLFTEFDHFVGQEDENIYFRTKLEAEKLVVEARERGLNTNIYRVGNLNYNTETEKFQENISDNAFYSVVKSFIEINMVPAFNTKVIDFSFVNHVSNAIVLLMNKKSLLNETHHVYNYNGISSIELGEYLQQSGFNNLKICEIEELFANYHKPEFQEHIMKIIIHAGLMGNLRDTNFHMVFGKTQLLLERLGFNWMSIDKEHVNNMLNYAKKVQFL